LKELKRGILLVIHWVGLVKEKEVQCNYNNKVMEIAKFFELIDMLIILVKLLF